MARDKKASDLSNRFSPQFWSSVDQRSLLYREIKSRLDELKSDVGAASMQQDLLCQEVVFISLQLESAKVRALEDGVFDQGVYTQMVNCLSGLLSKLGLQKAKSDKVPDLKTYLEARA